MGKNKQINKQTNKHTKHLPASAEDVSHVCSTLESGRALGGGNGSPSQYSSPGNPTDRGFCDPVVTVYSVTKSWMQLSMHHMYFFLRLFSIIG